MEHALLTLIASVIGGGIAGALAITWGLHLRLYKLESSAKQQQTQGAARARWSQDEVLARQLVEATKRPRQDEHFANDW